MIEPKIIIKNKGIRTKNFYLPPFELNEGEIILIQLPEEIITCEIEKTLIEFFCGVKKNKLIKINKQFTYVKDFLNQSYLDSFIYKHTVGRYLKKHSNLESDFSKKIFDIDWINDKTLIEKLPGTPRKKLSLYTTLSKNNYVIINLFALDKKGTNEIFEIISNNTKENGAVILFVIGDQFEDKCNKKIELVLF